MPSLVSKDDDLRTCAPVIGFEILRLLENTESKKISIFDAARSIKKKSKASPKSLYYGLIFLYAIELIEFEPPYVILNV